MYVLLTSVLVIHNISKPFCAIWDETSTSVSEILVRPTHVVLHKWFVIWVIIGVGLSFCSRVRVVNVENYARLVL